jgi:hypothetical protein
MMLLIVVEESVEPDPAAGVPVYKIQSGNHSLVETPRPHSPHPCTPACCRFDA